MTELEAHANAVSLAEARRDAARDAVTADKAARAGSVLARVIDALTRTDAEKALEDAEAALAAARSTGQAAAEAWVSETAQAEFAADIVRARSRDALIRTAERLEARAVKVRGWARLAETARAKMSDAADACASASSSEFLDAVTSNKAFALMSHMDTSTAKSAVDAAQAAVRELSEALPDRVSGQEVEVPDDLLDLALDMLGGGFDIFSFFNSQKLDAAAAACRSAEARLAPLAARLDALAQKAETDAAEPRAAVQDLEKPFYAAATARLPEPLRPSGS